MSMDRVQRALIGAVNAVLGEIPAAYDNEPFKPPSNATWAQVYFLPNTPSVETLGAEGEDLVDGIVQVDFNYPAKTGTAESRIDFEDIRAAFPAGARLTYSGQEVIIRNCGRSAGRPVDGWYRVSVTITWYALIPR